MAEPVVPYNGPAPTSSIAAYNMLMNAISSGAIEMVRQCITQDPELINTFGTNCFTNNGMQLCISCFYYIKLYILTVRKACVSCPWSPGTCLKICRRCISRTRKSCRTFATTEDCTSDLKFRMTQNSSTGPLLWTKDWEVGEFLLNKINYSV